MVKKDKSTSKEQKWKILTFGRATEGKPVSFLEIKKNSHYWCLYGWERIRQIFIENINQSITTYNNSRHIKVSLIFNSN